MYLVDHERVAAPFFKARSEITMTQDPPKKTSRTPWLIGCGIGLVLLLLCGGGLGLLGFRGWGVFQAGLEKANEEEAFAQNWQAPAPEASPEVFAPESVAGYSLTTSDENAAFPALGIESEGYHAVYEQGDDTVDVSVYRMTEAERSTTFDEIKRRIDDDNRFQFHTLVHLGRSLEFSVNPPELHGKLLHASGWLVFVRSTTVSDLDPFLRAYLEAVAADSDIAGVPEPSERPESADSEPTGESP